MTDLERALRDTLADPPVQVRENRYAEVDIRLRIERRRSRQKRTAAGLGVAAVVAAAIAVPVATGVDLGSSGSSNSADSRTSLDAKGGGVEGQKAEPQPAATVPAPVRSTANALAREYGRPLGQVEWVRTTAAAWGRLRPTASDASAAGPVYVLQIRDFRCVKNCPTDAQSTGPRPALVTAVRADGDRDTVRFQQPYNLATLGPVNTFTVR